MVSIILPLAFTTTNYYIVRKERSSNGGGTVPDLPIGSIRLKPRALRFMGPPAKVYNILNTVI
jgi:hypothetical protein